MKSLSHVRLFTTPWTVAYQAPLSMGFSRQLAPRWHQRMVRASQRLKPRKAFWMAKDSVPRTLSSLSTRSPSIGHLYISHIFLNREVQTESELSRAQKFTGGKRYKANSTFRRKQMFLCLMECFRMLSLECLHQNHLDLITCHPGNSDIY